MNTCGDCYFLNKDAVPDPQAGLCGGAPPSVVLVPANEQMSPIVTSPGAPARVMRMEMQLVRPSMTIDSPACALFLARGVNGESHEMG